MNGQRSIGVLVEAKSSVAQEYFAAVTWDGRRKLPVVIFSDMGGIDIEEVAEKHPEHVSKTHLSTLLPVTERIAKEADQRDRRHAARRSRARPRSWRR